jgi:hypothetical protein
MREIRPSGSEGGAGRKPRSYLYQVARASCPVPSCHCGDALPGSIPQILRLHFVRAEVLTT